MREWRTGHRSRTQLVDEKKPESRRGPWKTAHPSVLATRPSSSFVFDGARRARKMNLLFSLSPFSFSTRALRDPLTQSIPFCSLIFRLSVAAAHCSCNWSDILPVVCHCFPSKTLSLSLSSGLSSFLVCLHNTQPAFARRNGGCLFFLTFSPRTSFLLPSFPHSIAFSFRKERNTPPAQ